jgi:hypothetical protein
MKRMSIDEEIGKIPTQKLASDMPDEFTATVLKMTRDVKKGTYAGAPILKLDLQLENGEVFSTSYRIPKAWTGKGQLDRLLEHLKKLNLDLKEIVGKTFNWKREALEGNVQGNQRHYPISIKGQKKLKP